MKNIINVAVVQMSIEDGEYEKNRDRIVRAISECGPNHDLIVLPETATSGFASLSDVASIAEPLGGVTTDLLQKLAVRYSSVIVAGLAERAGDEIFNTSVVVSPSGIVGAYRKTHLWAADLGIFQPGCQFRRVDTFVGALGPLICYDVEFPEPARVVSALGAQIITVCNGNMSPYGPVHQRAMAARAQENQVFLVMANRTGRGRIDNFAGGSAIIGPDGVALVELGEEEGIGSARINLSHIAEVRRKYCYLADRRFLVEASATLHGQSELEIAPTTSKRYFT